VLRSSLSADRDTWRGIAQALPLTASATHVRRESVASDQLAVADALREAPPFVQQGLIMIRLSFYSRLRDCRLYLALLLSSLVACDSHRAPASDLNGASTLPTTGPAAAGSAAGASSQVAPAGSAAPAPRSAVDATGSAGSSGTNANAAGSPGSPPMNSGAGMNGNPVAGNGSAIAGASGEAASSSGESGSGGSGGNAAGSAAGAPAATPPRMPVFQKTSCIDPSQAKPDTEVNFPCNGVDVWVVVPTRCTTSTCGLIFNIHGGGMNDHATMDQATNMIALGSQANYIVVHPHKGTWSVSTDKDVVFSIMQQVIQAFDVDRKRVHSTGYSQGGQISWALGCEHADVIASIAPAEEINRVSDCWKTSKLPVRELSVLFAYGKQDSIGGGYDAATSDVSKFVSAQHWMGPETIAGAEGSKYWRQRWTGKDANVLEFISHNYTSTGVGGILAGHCLPMSTGETFVSCSLPVDYDWGKEVVAFFQAHPIP
jgi:pimeloyl-ACP methyl ester carboxylesterase